MIKKIKIILLNHSAEALFGLCNQLERRNFEVLVLAELDQFLENVVEFSPDVILYDHILPVNKTVNILREIKKHDKTRHTKILLASEVANADHHWKYSDGSLKKPYTADDIIRKVNEVLPDAI